MACITKPQRCKERTDAMLARNRLLWILGIVFASSLADSAFALPHWNPKPAGPATAYASDVRHFIVVSPTPAVSAAVPLVAPPVAVAPDNSFTPLRGEIISEPAAGLPVLPRTHPHHHAAGAKGPAPILWQQQVEPVTAYPWGWFGARRHTATTGHRRFLGGEFDWSLRRGD
jgi:hypothetical protein